MEAVLGLIGVLVTATLALVGTRWLAKVQRKTAENEEKLNRYESWDHLHDNLRTDYDRAIARAKDAETERDDYRRRALAAERQIDDLLALRENKEP